jgi:hypothetical protein
MSTTRRRVASRSDHRAELARRIVGGMRRVPLLLAACALAVGCSATTTTTVQLGGTLATAPPPPRCAWYTPMTGQAYGQTVTLTAQGPACRGLALIRWVAQRTGLPWASTAAAAADGMPVPAGTAIAQLERAGTVVQVWQAGSALPTDQTAGGLADDFQAAGWAVQQPECPPAGCGPPVTPPVSPGA